MIEGNDVVYSCPCGDWHLYVDDSVSGTYLTWRGEPSEAIQHSITRSIERALVEFHAALDDAILEHATECDDAAALIDAWEPLQ